MHLCLTVVSALEVQHFGQLIFILYFVAKMQKGSLNKPGRKPRETERK